MMTMVVSAKNGSIVAVTGSGIRHMSDSLIAFQPAIEEPSNIKPSAKTSSSMMPVSKVTCCHLPRGSVKRRSTYLTSLSLMDLRTSLAVVMDTSYAQQVVVMWRRTAADGEEGVRTSDGIEAGFSGTDTDGFLDVGNEDLAIADAAGLRGAADGF